MKQRTMNEASQLVPPLATILTASGSFTLVILIYVLGEYAALNRQDRPSSEREPYYYSSLALIMVFWTAVIGLFSLISGALFSWPILIWLSAILLVTQLVGVGGGITWAAYKILS